MSPGVVQHVAAVLVVILTTSCGSSFEDVRPDAPVTVLARPSRVLAPQPASHEWSGRLEDLDEVTLVEVPYAPRKLRVEDVTRDEFKTFMLWALRDIDFKKLKAEMDPPTYEVMAAAWWGKHIEQRDLEITQGYLALCQKEKPGSCIELSPGSPYLTDFQKYRVALGIGMSRILAGFLKELGDEARAMVNPDTLKQMLVGAMVSYMILLANPDPIFTKALAAAATFVVTAMLGARVVCDVVFGFRSMLQEVDAARTFNQLADAGRRYGEKLGTAVARILVMAVTALLNEGGAVSKLLGFPKLPQGIDGATGGHQGRAEPDVTRPGGWSEGPRGGHVHRDDGGWGQGGWNRRDGGKPRPNERTGPEQPGPLTA